MSATVLEALMNAEINLVMNRAIGICGALGKEQLHNAIVLLDKGYSIHDEVEPLLEQYGSIENVPEKEKSHA